MARKHANIRQLGVDPSLRSKLTDAERVKVCWHSAISFSDLTVFFQLQERITRWRVEHGRTNVSRDEVQRLHSEVCVA